MYTSIFSGILKAVRCIVIERYGRAIRPNIQFSHLIQCDRQLTG